MSGRKVEGYWDCTHCGTTGIGGLTKTCPNCGNPQAKNVKFYLKPGAKKYLKPEVAKDYGKGADWVCAFCGSFNRYNESNCKNCGAGKADAEEDYFGRKVSTISKESYTSEYYESENEDDVPSYEEKNESDDIFLEQENRNNITSNTYEDDEIENISKIQHFISNINFKALLGITGGIIGIVALIMLLVSIFTPKEYDAYISDKSWDRSVTIQELRTLNEDDWDVPEGARVYDERREIRDYDHVIVDYVTEEKQVPRREIDHYEYEYTDNGDGTFDEVEIPIYTTVYDIEYEEVPVWDDIPIYDTRYYYEIDRWCYDRTEKSSGKADEPYWPEFTLTDKERESGKSDTYTVYFKTDEDVYSKSFSYDEWKAFKIGDTVQITVVAGIVTEIEAK